MGAESPQDHPYVAHYDEPDVPDATDAAQARRDAEALEVVLIWAALLLLSKRLHPGQWVAVGFMAAASTAAVVVALSAGSVSLGGTEWPYIVAFPLIVAAAVLELLRTRRLRARWGE